MLQQLLWLQQHLPFTVLKRASIATGVICLDGLQQHLPFTVLKQADITIAYWNGTDVATALTVYGIETYNK